VQIIAHRGNSWLAPQNTIAAFDAARRAEADAIELDIQVLADGDAAVIHNDTVDATTNGSGAVRDFTAEELGELDAGSWFSAAFAGERVPLLSDVLTFLDAAPTPSVLLEVKGVWEREPLGRALASIEEAGLADRFIVQSFEPETVALAGELAPGFRREWLLENWREDAAEVAYDLHVQGVNPDGRILLEHPDFVDEMHGAGLSVAVWTLNEPHQWAAARRIGVDAIITDRPSMLRGWLSAHA